MRDKRSAEVPCRRGLTLFHSYLHRDPSRRAMACSSTGASSHLRLGSSCLCSAQLSSPFPILPAVIFKKNRGPLSLSFSVCPCCSYVRCVETIRHWSYLYNY